MLDIPERKIVKKWRLQPGKMLLVDMEQGRIIDDDELKRTLATQKPYRDWIARSRIALDELPAPAPPIASEVPLLDRQQAFGYTQEDLRIILAPMAESGEEAVGSMGNDAALPVLSHRPKTLYSYFKQLFAQVTNPPIDPIREELVMSLVTFIGPRPNLLGIDVTDPAMRLEATQPILTNDAMEKIRHIALFTDGAFKSFELDICYPAAWGANGMEAALASLCAQAEDAIHLGYNILIVSDRKVSADLMPIPALLATAAVHQHLVRKGLRTSTGLVVETGSAREVHHFALLAGYGAEAIHPYLALETLVTLADRRADASAARIGEALPEGDQQGALQGDVEDGHLHLPVLLRRADLRSGRPAARIRRQVFHRHAEQRRRRRACSRLPKRRAGSIGSRSATIRCSPTRSTPAASTSTGYAAKSTRGRRTPSRSSSTRRARAATATYQANTRRSSTISRSGC